MVKHPDTLKQPALGVLLPVVLVLQIASASAAEVTARVDRSRLVEGETVTLVLQTGDPQQSLDTDFGALQEDFEVIDRRSETQMSIVNGKQTAIVRVLVTLEPRRSGQLEIPALQFAGARTAPIAVNVEPAPELAPGEAPPVFIELSLDPAEAPYYVHAQLSLTVRIFYQQNLTEAAINPPSPQQASVRLLDEIPFQAERNGVRYRVLERRYAIFPERSGEFVIPPLQLSGRLIERPADRLWQPSVRGRRVHIESDPLSIEVQPRPAGYSGDHWLPARRITISQQLSDTELLRVGEPVTRTVILDAVGLEENMIEEPGWPAMEEARIYPDQPQGISRDDGRWVLGHKEFRYAVVPEQPGELVLPEIRLDWWDTVANQQKTAVLPEHRIRVAASELVPVQAVAGPVADSVPVPQAGPGYPVDSTGDRWRLLSMVLGLLWLATLLMYFRRSPPERNGMDNGSVMSVAESEVVKEIKKACSSGDAAAARSHLRRWVRLHGPKQARGSVMEFAAGLDDPGLRNAIHRFDAGSFGPAASGDWNGREFWKSFDSWLRGRRTAGSGKQASEPDLYARAR
jgi:hypothetical protein